MSANALWARGACLCVLFGSAAGLQSAGLAVGAGSAWPGGTASVSVVFSPLQGSAVASLQFDLVYGATLSAGSAAAGSAATNAGKNLYTNAVGNGVGRFLIAGLNQTAISQGSVVDLAINVAAGAVPGIYTIQIQNVVASDPYGNALLLSAANGAVTVLSSSSSQTIAFGALSNVSVGAAPFGISATASSGLPVSFASNTPAVCTVSGNTVTVVAAGTCSITASQAGNSDYAAATPVTQSFTVSPASQTATGNPASQTIVFGALGNVTAGVAPFGISATASSGLPVSFASNTPAVCTVSGSTVTVVAAGTCSITASQGGNANYAAATPVTESFTANPVLQTITFGAVSNVGIGAAPFGIGATASSGLPVSFASTTPAVCTIVGNIVTVLAAGTCSITASQAGNGIYAAATPVTQSFAAGAGSLTITTSSLPAGTAGTAYAQTLSASGGVPPYHNWVLSSGALPPWLTLDGNSGAITGVPPSAAGSPFAFSVIVKDSAGNVSAARNLSIGISQPPALTIVTSSPLPQGAAGASYAQAFTATGGVPPYANWTITAGNSAPGTSLSGTAAGLLSGTPTAAGTFTFVVQVTDGANGTATKQFSLTVNAAGTITISPDGIVNAASYLGGGVAPGEVVTIFGSGLGPNAPVYPEAGSNGNVGATLGGVQVLFDGVAAPLLYVQASQVGAVTPYEISGETSTQVQIIYQGQSSTPVTVPVVSAAPGVFTQAYLGSGAGAILNEDGTINSPDNPAAAGSLVWVYATGEGQTNPPGVDGAANGPLPPRPVQTVTATIGGLAANLQYAGGVAGFVAGVLQVGLQTPAGLASGDALPVVLNIGGATSQAGVTLSVKGSGQ